MTNSTTNGGLLVIFHCRSNTGYAIASLESAFWSAARRLFRPEQIHFSYPDISQGVSTSIADIIQNIVEFDPKTKDQAAIHKVSEYIRNHKITCVLGFDQPVYRRYYRPLRRAGISKFISYQGAPMSSINRGLKLLLKRMEIAATPYKPDLFIFESNAMVETAIHGRGISPAHVARIYLGVDTHSYCPDRAYRHYAYTLFDIPQKRKILFYSGHMEERKGVQVIMDAAIHICDHLGREDVHFLLLGNQPGEEQRFIDYLNGRKAAMFVTFGGYRDDIAKLHNSCIGGIIASTGWDSMTMSSIEMTASGLPIVVSDLQGLQETVLPGETGFLFPPGDSAALATRIVELVTDSEKQCRMAIAARTRAETVFSRSLQIRNLEAIFRREYLDGTTSTSR